MVRATGAKVVTLQESAAARVPVKPGRANSECEAGRSLLVGAAVCRSSTRTGQHGLVLECCKPPQTNTDFATIPTRHSPPRPLVAAALRSALAAPTTAVFQDNSSLTTPAHSLALPVLSVLHNRSAHLCSQSCKYEQLDQHASRPGCETVAAVTWVLHLLLLLHHSTLCSSHYTKIIHVSFSPAVYFPLLPSQLFSLPLVLNPNGFLSN